MGIAYRTASGSTVFRFERFAPVSCRCFCLDLVAGVYGVESCTPSGPPLDLGRHHLFVLTPLQCFLLPTFYPLRYLHLVCLCRSPGP